MKSGISGLHKDTPITQGYIDAGKLILRRRVVGQVIGTMPIGHTAQLDPLHTLSKQEDPEDISHATEVLRDPADPVLDWEQVKRDLLGQH